MSRLDGLIDTFAMWTEDRKARAPTAFRAADGALDWLAPLPPLPADAPSDGIWTAPSPRPFDGDRLVRVHARRARGARRGVVILVPPWKVPSLTSLSGWAKDLAHAGHDVWTIVPPRHLDRTAPGAANGEGFVSTDLTVLRAAFEQLVLELRLLAALARRAGGETAMVGLSLGALAAARAATAPEGLDRAVLVAPPADLAAVFTRTAIGRRYVRLAERAGTEVPPAEELARLLAPFCSDDLAPTARRVLVAVAGHDRIALPEGAVALARAWGVEARVYPRGHMTLLFACRAVRRDVTRFLRAP
jgi:predicted alpha/beta hydrolase family esterase